MITPEKNQETETKFSREFTEYLELFKAQQRERHRIEIEQRERHLRRYADLALCVAIFLMVAAVALAVWWV